MFFDARTQRVLVQRVTQGKIAGTSDSGPRTHTGTTHMCMGMKAQKFAYGDSPYA